MSGSPNKCKVLVLGAGVAGLATSHHLAHRDCVMLDRNAYPYGHSKSHTQFGATWDEGPHVSFTKSEYVRELLKECCNAELFEIEPTVSNWYKGHWITHPVQTSLYQVPQPLRTRCLEDMLATIEVTNGSEITNYRDWLEASLGKVFTDEFASAYTRKYWTVEPEQMSVDWVGQRVHKPSREDVLTGSGGPLPESTHYIRKIRYPSAGGFQSFFAGLGDGATIEFESEIVDVDLESKTVRTANDQHWNYEHLVSTIPVPIFVNICRQSTSVMRSAAKRLRCTQVHLVNVLAPHRPRRSEHWMYVYDEDKLSTRITSIDRLAQKNAPNGLTGIQVEVYSSTDKPLQLTDDQLIERVVEELIELDLIDSRLKDEVQSHVQHVSFANVLFLQNTATDIETIWKGFEKFGLVRETKDLSPIPGDSCEESSIGSLSFAGRFGLWNYSWTDDCIKRGKSIAERLKDKY